MPRYRRSESDRRRKKKLLYRALCVAAVLLAGALLVFAGCRPGRSGGNPSSSSSENTATGSSSGTSSVQASSQEAASAAASSQPTASAAPSSQEAPSAVSSAASSAAPSGTASKPHTGIYTGVTWRSPYAQTADIYKHGRDLMLLNNYYELPEDFKWDLVSWSTGESVDAMSLNAPQYDKIQAVDRAAYQPLKQLFAAAKAAGVPLQMVSAYRSINLQDRLFSELVSSYQNSGYSQENAIKRANTARTFTGTSEHNTGYGFDLLNSGNWYLSESFETTPEFKWLQANAADYGFILRYAKDKVSTTGIMYEPWHYRYVGVEAAKAIQSQGLCLEEYIAKLDAAG